MINLASIYPNTVSYRPKAPLLKLLNISDNDFTTPEMEHKKATSDKVFNFLTNCAQKDPDISSIMCGKFSDTGALFISYRSGEIYSFKFMFPGFSGYYAKPYTKVSEYIKLIGDCYVDRVDYVHTHKPIRIR